MPETSATLTPVPALGRDALRIVLFGMPDAGKSSLLGALAQATQTQEHLLNGHITDLTQGLAELQHRLYEEKPRETLEEVVPYAVVFEPFAAQRPNVDANRTEAVLVDCDGRVANELLARRRSLTVGSNEGSLVQAILEADALLLVVDASARPAQIDADFLEFGRFLRLLEQSRGRRSDVGGLPVFLVLTKCDLLAQPADTPAAWMDRIEERKRQVDSRFQEFLARQRKEGPLPFGRIDLHLWATAVKRPPLTGTPAKPREPYGVAELFRQALELARAFQERRTRSGHRLFWTVAGCTGVVVSMATLVTALLVNRPEEDPGIQELVTKVENYRVREAQTPSNRLREPLQRRVSELTDLQNDPHFSRLRQEKQDYVLARLQELHDYRSYEEKLRALPRIDSLRSERELEEVENGLTNLALPAEHQPDWSQTDAALFRAQRLEEIKVFRKAMTEMEDWYNLLIRRGQDLWSFAPDKAGAPLSWPDWHQEAQTLLGEGAAPPHRPKDKLSRSSVTYDTVLRFDTVAAAGGKWQALRQRLERVRDLSAALGLPGALPGPSLLDIPAGFQAEQAADRLQELEKVYPRFQQEFTLSDLPDAIVGEVRQAARTRYEHALKAGREVVLRHLQDVSPEGRESPESWRRLQPWLAAPEDLKAWRVLATVLARLQNPSVEDPISALDAFVRRDVFELVLRRLVLEIPEDVKLRPAGRLSVHHLSGGEKKPTLIFELTGEEQREARRRVIRYTFQSLGDASLDYKSADTLWADLPVQYGDSAGWVLTWARSRSQAYQFERLARPPRLHQKGKENIEGEVQESISLQVSLPEGGVPKMPDLMPVVPVKLGKR